ncbi:hypothetical protein HanRHA438_Chr09g0379851 [Helianthus annuus]|nr:hypothetical protein HanRHA438_Chr09g0379851 [Helianthus annuus]
MMLQRRCGGGCGGFGRVAVGLVVWRWFWWCVAVVDVDGSDVRWVWWCGGGCGGMLVGLVVWRWVSWVLI